MIAAENERDGSARNSSTIFAAMRSHVVLISGKNRARSSRNAVASGTAVSTFP